MVNVKSHPYLFSPPKEYGVFKRSQMAEQLRLNYLLFKRAYYCENHPDVLKEHVVSDTRFDMVENAVREQYPLDPILDLVGWKDEYLNEINMPVPDASLVARYPLLNWSI